MPQTPKNNIPNNIYAIDVEFMAHHQSEEYVAQMPDPAKHISKYTQALLGVILKLLPLSICI